MTVATFQRMMDDHLIEDVLRSNSGTEQQEIKLHQVACTLTGLPDAQANAANKAQTTWKKVGSLGPSRYSTFERQGKCILPLPTFLGNLNAVCVMIVSLNGVPLLFTHVCKLQFYRVICAISVQIV